MNTPEQLRAARPRLPAAEASQEILWFLLLGLVPLGVNLWGQHPFALPKVLALRLLVMLLAAGTVVIYLRNGRCLRRDLAANPLLGPAALLALIIGVTTAAGVDPRLSFWGSAARGQGALTLLCYLLLFVLAANSGGRRGAARRLVGGMVATAVPLLAIAFLQGAGWQPAGLVSDARSPLFATLGRANFLGAYLAILIPLTVALRPGAPRRRANLLAVLLALQLVAVVLTLARAAWLGTAVGLAAFGLLWYGPRLGRRQRGLLWGGLAALMLAGPLAVIGAVGEAGESVAARRLIWQSVAALIGQRPLLGYGPDSLEIVFPSVFPPALVYYQGRQVFVDRAHNFLLDWAVTTGVPGLLALLLLLLGFCLFMARALRRARQPERRALLAGIFAAVLASMANNLSSFDVTATAVATWVLLGLGMGLARPLPNQRARPRGQAVLLPLLLGCTLLAAGLGWAAVQTLRADVAARSAALAAAAGQWPSAAAAADRAVLLWSHEPAHHAQRAQVYQALAASNSAAAAYALGQADEAWRTAVALRPGDLNLWLQTAQFYAALGPAGRGPAGDAFRQAQALAPNHAVVAAAWGRSALQNGDAATAVPLLRRAVQLDATYGAAYLDLGAASLALDRPAAAAAAYREAARLLPQSTAARAGLAASETLLRRTRAPDRPGIMAGRIQGGALE